MTFPLGGSADTVQVSIVPEFSRFPAELRRGVDQAMRELALRVDSALESVERSAADTGRQIGADFQAGGEIAERSFHELQRAANHDLAQIEATSAAAAVGVSKRFQTAAALAGAAMLGIGAAAVAGLGLLTAMGLKSAATLEQTQISFNALLGSVEEGTRVFKELQQFAAVTPFEFTQITGVAQRFFTFADALGMTKQQVTGFLTVLGDLASVTGSGAEGMNRAALAMSQMAAKGRLSAQDVNQLADAFPGFNVRAAIAAQLGMSVADTMAAMENGTIDAQTGLRALLAGMRAFPGAAGAMEKQSQTLLGVFSTFKDTFSQALVAGFAPVIPGIKDTLTQMTPILGEAIGQLAPALGEALTGLLSIAGPLVKGLAAAVLPVVRALSDALKRIGESGALEKLGVALGQVFEELGPSLPLLAEFLIALVEVAIPVLMLLALVLKPVTPLLVLFTDAIAELNRALAMIDWAAVGKAIGDFFGDLWQKILDFFRSLADGLGDIPTQTTAAFQAMVDAGAARVTALIGQVRAIPARIGAALAGLGGLLVDKGRDMIRGLWNGIAGMGGWLYGQIRSFVSTNIVGALKGILGIGSPSRVMAEEVGRWIPPGIGLGAEQAMPGLRAQLAGIGGQIPAAAVGGAGGGAAVMFGPGSVVVQFAGATPTPQQAFDTGIKVGQGIMDAINRRGVATAVKQRT